MIDEAVISAACVGLGVLIAKGIDWVRARSENKVKEQESDSKVKTTEVEKAAAIYRDMISDLREDMDKMMVNVKDLEDERLACREENAGLKAELKSLRN